MTNKLAVVMVTGDFYPDSSGGVQHVVHHLAKGLVAAGHRVTVVTRRLCQEMPPCEKIDGIHVVRFSSRTNGVARFHLSEFTSSRQAFRSIMRRERVDLVHIHEPLPGLGAVAALAGTAVPCVYTLHGQWSVQWRDARRYGSEGGGIVADIFSEYLKAIERLAMRRARRIVAPSRFMARTAREIYSIAPQRLRIIPNGVDLERFRPLTRHAARKALGLPEDKFILGFAGRLSGEKGLSILLRSVSLLKREMPDIILVVAGKGPERSALENQVARFEIGKEVRFLGHLKGNMPSFYNALDLLVVPSIREPFGLITIESLACGAPVIGGPVGGTAEVLRELDAGLVFPEVSAEAMAIKIREMRPLISPAMRRRCREHVKREFSWDRMVKAYEQTYLECVTP